MGQHLDFGAGLRPVPCDAKFRKTFIGQAHTAGTGPEGKTCRHCRFWHSWKSFGISGPLEPVAVGYAPKNEGSEGLELKEAYCNKRILNKAETKIPHFAPACMFYQESPDPQPVKYEPNLSAWHPAPHKNGKWKVIFAGDQTRSACGPSGIRAAVFSSFVKAVARAEELNQPKRVLGGIQ